jgi:uncharacterized membrane protein YdbT with pleckstrin-like domain
VSIKFSAKQILSTQKRKKTYQKTKRWCKKQDTEYLERVSGSLEEMHRQQELEELLVQAKKAAGKEH